MKSYAFISGDYNIAFTKPKESIVISPRVTNVPYDFNKFKTVLILPKTDNPKTELKKIPE